MSEPDIEAIRDRKDAATPGPWEADGSEVYVTGSRDWVAESCRYDVGPDDQSRPTDAGDLDAEFIAHARTDIPDLLEAIDRLRSMLIDAETEAQMQAAEVERLRGADDIVRKLATPTWVYDSYICIHCNALVADEEPEVMDEPHKEDCPHALALAYVEANPA